MRKLDLVSLKNENLKNRKKKSVYSVYHYQTVSLTLRKLKCAHGKMAHLRVLGTTAKLYLLRICRDACLLLALPYFHFKIKV